MHIHVNDTVEVISGDDRGKRGRVLRVDGAAGKIVVEGVNKVYKHLKPGRRNPQGGRLSKEMPVAVANVLLYCNSCGRGRRVGRRVTATGKVRYCKKCGAELGAIGKARAKA
jgi:large subunit ribosomal protein L24